MVKFVFKFVFILLYVTAINFIASFGDAKIFLFICYVMMSLDTIIAIYLKYYQNDFSSVTSRKFILGIIRKMIILHCLFFLAYALHFVFGFNVYVFYSSIYILYEIKSIDEKLAIVLKNSILDDIVRKIMFFKKLKDDFTNKSENTKKYEVTDRDKGEQ